MSQQRSDGSGQTSQSWVSQVSALYCNTYTSSFCKLFCILFMATQSTLRQGNLFCTEWFCDSFLLWKNIIQNSFWNTHFRDQKLCSQQKMWRRNSLQNYVPHEEKRTRNLTNIALSELNEQLEEFLCLLSIRRQWKSSICFYLLVSVIFKISLICSLS